MVALSDELVPLDLPVQLRFDLYLTYHPDIRSSGAAMEAIQCAKDVFSARHQPWFREYFIHPERMREEGWGTPSAPAMPHLLDDAIR